MTKTSWTKRGYLLASDAFRTLADKMDPRKANGGVFLGLNGIVIKSHGGTDAEGFASAVDIGYDMVHHALLAKIGQALTLERRDGTFPAIWGNLFVTPLRSAVLGCGNDLPRRVLTQRRSAQSGATSD